MTKKRYGLVAGIAGLLAIAALVPPAVWGGHEGDSDEVHVKKIIRCEGEECDEIVEEMGEAGVKVIVDGEGRKRVHIRRMHCDKEECEHGHDGKHRALFLGDGDFEVLSGDGGYRWMAHSGGGFLGVRMTELTDELRAHFGIPEGSGVMVSKVVEDSPAAAAGVRVGDVITSVGDEEIESPRDLVREMHHREAGDEVALGIWRDGATTSATATLDESKGFGPQRMMRMRRGGMGPGHFMLHHMGDHGDSEGRVRKVVVKCDEDDANCDTAIDIAGLEDFDCGGEERCEVKVECQSEDDCSCTVNGESRDCDSIPGFSNR